VSTTNILDQHDHYKLLDIVSESKSKLHNRPKADGHSETSLDNYCAGRQTGGWRCSAALLDCVTDAIATLMKSISATGYDTLTTWRFPCTVQCFVHSVVQLTAEEGVRCFTRSLRDRRLGSYVHFADTFVRVNRGVCNFSVTVSGVC
jgi:hypothetical protein